MALGARGSTTFDLTASSDLFRLGAPELNARLVILTTAGIVAAATTAALVFIVVGGASAVTPFTSGH